MTFKYLCQKEQEQRFYIWFRSIIEKFKRKYENPKSVHPHIRVISYLNADRCYKVLYRDFTDLNTGKGIWRETVLISFQVPAVGILKLNKGMRN